MPTNIQTGTLSAQTLDGLDGATNTNIIYGDANKLKGNSVGGADTITGGDDGATNYIYGDAYSMEGKSKGGADFLLGGANGATNYIFGDAFSMQGKVQGGNDILVGGLNSKNIIYGDAYTLRDGARGGNDVLKIANDLIITKNNFVNEPVLNMFGAFSDNKTIQNISIENNNISHEINVTQKDIAYISIKNNFGVGDARTMMDSQGGDDEISVGNNGQVNAIGFTNTTENSYIYAQTEFNIDIYSDLKSSSSSLIELDIDSNLSITNLEVKLTSKIYQEKFLTIDIQHNELAGDAINMTNSRGGNDKINIGNSLTAIANATAVAIAYNSARSISISSQFYNLDENDNQTFAQIIVNSKASANLNIGNYSILHDLSINQNELASINLDYNFVVGDANNMVASRGGDDSINLGNSIHTQAKTVIYFSSIILDESYAGTSFRMYSEASIDITSASSAKLEIGSLQTNLNYSLSQTKLSAISIDHNQLSGDAFSMINGKGGDDSINIGNDASAAANINIFYKISYNNLVNSNDYTYILPGADSVNQIQSSATSDVSLNVKLNSETRNSLITQNELTVVNVSDNVAFGDSQQMKNSIGGNDVISVANYVSVKGSWEYFIDPESPVIPGQENSFPIFVQNDLGKITIKNNLLYGDAETMMNSNGGDDTLSIGARKLIPNRIAIQILDNSLYGDAKTMSHSNGGNDILTGADGKGSVTYLYGDAQFTDGKSKAGDDTLISGQGNDQMWGDFGSKLTRSSGRDNDCDSRDDNHESEHKDEDDDDGDNDHCSSNVNKYAGRDTFVFGTDNGKDTIFDFQRGLDKIELKGIAYFQAFNDLCIATSESNPANSVIEFLNGNSITLVGVNYLDASDFVFA